MKILITGGAGYIGSHIAKVFLDNGASVKVLDDLTNSNTKRIDSLNVDFINASVNNSEKVLSALKDSELVIHCAAYKSVEESELNPQKYEEVNVLGTENLLAQMVNAKVSKLIFASTAAVYGNSVKSPISERYKPTPISNYGRTKLDAEECITRFTKTYNISAVSLRFFNAVGAATNSLVDTSSDNLFPRVFKAIELGKSPEIFGDDYPTPDGTCIRDYIHVLDIAEAHIAVSDFLRKYNGHEIFNVGTGMGYSVKEIISGIQKVTGTDFKSIVRPRRSGDLDIAFADAKLIFEKTGWKARFDLSEMINSAWLAWKADKK